MQLNSVVVVCSSVPRGTLRAQACAWSIAFFLFAVPVRAQVSAILSGTVADQSGALVSAAAVSVKNVDTGAVRSTVSDAEGHYQFFSLPVGQYEIRGAKAGFSEEVRTGVHLVVGQSATVDMALRVGESSQQITVNGDAPLVGVTTANVAGLVGERQLKNLPLNGRSYDELLTLNPGVVNFTWEKTGGIGVSNSTVGNNFAVAGNRPQQNLFLLNGVEFTGAAENNMQPGGTSQQLLGIDAVREFNLLIDSYGAEYGKRPGAQVLIVTQPGTNQLHGSLFEFLRNNALDAANYFDPGSAPGFQRNQFGGALGGPIQKNKTFIFGNYEGFRQRLHQTGVDLVPDANARAGSLPCKLVSPAPNPCPASGLAFVGVSPLINAWPAPRPGAPDFGGISEAFNNPLQTIRDDFGTVRLDHIFSAKDTLSAVYTIDDSVDFTPVAFSLYMADAEIRVSPKFTLTVGFRDEFTNGWNEAHGRAATYTFTNGIISTQPNIGNSAFTVNNGKFLPQPRAGIAWSPFGNKHATVFRAGFGMYNDLQDALGYRTDQNAPYNPTYSLPNLPVAQIPISPGAPVPATAKLVPGGTQPDLKTPTLVSWSFRIQEELSANTAFTVGYVGSHGYHEIIGIDANEPFPVICPATPCPATYPGTFPAGIAGTPVPAGTYYWPTATKPNPVINNTWTYFSEGDSAYNALQVDVNRRFSSGFSVRGVYTRSKTIDDGDSLNATTSGGEPALASNPFNLRADRGLANFDVRNVGVINASYALPFGPGKRFDTNRSGVGKILAGGWTVNSIVTLQGGFPFTPQLSYNPSNTGDTRNPVRPFVNPAFTGPVILGSPTQWFNPAAFLGPPNSSGFDGNLGRDTLIGPGLATWDLSFLKNTPIRERLNLQFRAELFNLLNRTNFNTPNAIAFTPTGVSPTAGVITSTSTTSRQIQFGLKLLW